jgi:hypothetical protein
VENFSMMFKNSPRRSARRRADFVERLEVRVMLAIDFGDAPISYGTELANDGARHDVISGFQLGSEIDTEADGQPSALANGDDLAGMDDEDGVTIPALVAGEPASVVLSVQMPAGMFTGRVSAFFDWNKDGDFQDVDEMIPSIPVNPGSTALTVNVPAMATPGATFARFRLTDNSGVGPTGVYFGGEVEDYRVTVLPGIDFGDAPASYDGSDHARHARRSGLYLGARIDGETDFQPSVEADGDDLAGVDDDDGITFPALVAGEPASVLVSTHLPTGMFTARVSAFFDWNNDGDFQDVDEMIPSIPVNSGNTALTVNVPAVASPGLVYARFRLTESSSTGPTGLMLGGEVEDYRVNVAPGVDYGDAPATYDAFDHARHSRRSGLYLGSNIDGELDFQPSVNADGDDLAGIDDDDGVTIPAIVAGERTSVMVSVHMPTAVASGPRLSAFFDWNGDGDFQDVDEMIPSIAVNSGNNALTVNVPNNAVPGQTYARFRLADSSVGPTGSTLSGEVEDYRITVIPGTDFGDAPASYDAFDHARHLRRAGIYLGASIDGEIDYQFSDAADGDDLAGIDDDDGITFPTITPGEQASIMVSAHLSINPFTVTSGRLSAFFDWNRDGDFQDVDEMIPSITVSHGHNALLVNVPTTALPGLTYARFRLTDGSSIGPSGSALAGEVEDYRISVVPGTDYGDAPAVYDTFDPARHGRRSGLYLGAGVDGELGYQSNVEANGDDLAGIDDDDGVTFPALVAGETASVIVATHLPTGTPTGRLSAFFDWNNDGDFNDTGELIPSISVPNGSTALNVSIPATATPGPVYARFRLTDGSTVGPTGLALAGEVEDYRVTLLPGTDYGDAPASYDGPSHARHTRVSGFYLGSRIDGELDYQPNTQANGDDLAGVDDEDGVTIPQLIMGESATVVVRARVPAGAPARLTAFIDWNLNGLFTDDTPITFTSIVNGENTLTVPVPADAVSGETYARFRLSTTTVGPVGPVTGGEVEDYLVEVVPVSWVEPGAQAIWDAQANTLTVTGPTTVNSNPTDGGEAEPTINVSGSEAVVIFAPESNEVHLNSLNLSNGALASLASSSANGGALQTAAGATSTGFALVIENGLSIDSTSRLDLAGSALILRNATFESVRALIASGYNDGDWAGTGINSSAAANDMSGLTTLGYADNAELQATEFAGVSGLDGTEILVRYTYYGDADLSGSVDLDDFNLFLAGYQDPTNVPQSWIYGDFDYSGSVDLDDFNLFLVAYQAGGDPL